MEETVRSAAAYRHTGPLAYDIVDRENDSTDISECFGILSTQEVAPDLRSVVVRLRR